MVRFVSIETSVRLLFPDRSKEVRLIRFPSDATSVNTGLLGEPTEVALGKLKLSDKSSEVRLVKFASEETSLKAQLSDRFNEVSCVSPDSGEISTLVKSPPLMEREERFLR